MVGCMVVEIVSNDLIVLGRRGAGFSESFQAILDLRQLPFESLFSAAHQIMMKALLRVATALSALSA